MFVEHDIVVVAVVVTRGFVRARSYVYALLVRNGKYDCYCYSYIASRSWRRKEEVAGGENEEKKKKTRKTPREPPLTEVEFRVEK